MTLGNMRANGVRSLAVAATESIAATFVRREGERFD
jgi:hypothetical protein